VRGFTPAVGEKRTDARRGDLLPGALLATDGRVNLERFL